MAGLRTATVDGLTFSEDGWTSPDGFTLWMDELDGWGSGAGPGVRRDRTDRLWAHGEFAERGWRSGRLVTIKGDATAPTVDAATVAEQKINALLADGTFGLLAVTDTSTVDMFSETELFTQPNIGWKNDTTLTYQVQLLCPDPRRYGTAVSASTGVATAGGGLAYPLDDVLDYGDGGNSGTLTLTNDGSTETASIVHTLTGVAPGGFTITHLQTGRRLIYAGTLISGQSLILDGTDGSVMLDGYADRSPLLVRREWVRLGKAQSGTWLLEAVGSADLQLVTEVKPAWW